MDPAQSAAGWPEGPAPAIDIVVPVFNEERDLEPSVRRLRAYLDTRFPLPTRLTIADNTSIDATADLRGIWRLLRTRRRLILPGLGRQRRNLVPARVRTFAIIGVLSTLAYAALFGLIRTVASAPVANAVALVVTAVANTAANRRLTFGVRGRESLVRDHLAGLIAFGAALAITTASIATLALVAPSAGRVLELVVLIAANGVATAARFLLLRAWIDRRPGAAPSTPSARLERTVS